MRVDKQGGGIPMAYSFDFAEIKSRYTIEQVADKLGLVLKSSGKTHRGPCPACKGGSRDLCITPGKGFYCWGVREGGDLLQLIAHVRQCEVKDAARWLDGGTSSRGTSVPSKKETVPRTEEERGMRALEYLEATHPAVEALGFEPEEAAALGVGYAPCGTMKGNVLIPVRLPDGTLCGYVGITDAVLPAQWHGIETNVVALKRPA